MNTMAINDWDILGKINLDHINLIINPDYILYHPEVEVLVETKNYTLRTAKKDDLVALFQLRSKIFECDGTDQEDKLEYDDFDLNCDHLIIVDNKTEKLCGTYRIIYDEDGKRYYSGKEFQLDEFLALPGNKIELGRACIAPEHQNGHTLDLLWKGIGAYALKVNASYVFGCSSIWNVTPTNLKHIIHYLEAQGNLDLNTAISPVTYADYSSVNEGLSVPEDSHLKRMIPPLLRSYFKSGAKVYGEPCWDRDWDCYDFFTVLELSNLSSGYKKRYFSIGGVSV